MAPAAHHKHHKHEHAHEDQKAQAPTDTSEPSTSSAKDNQLDKVKAELAEYKDKYLRVLAEGENARKRLQKEKQEMIQYAVQNVIVDFLNPIDHMENALQFTEQMSDDVKHWAVGFQMILGQFKDVLTANGISPFISVGTPFDPHRHEAIETVVKEGTPPGVVVEEHLKGYLMADKVIRPARVKVSAEKKKVESHETANDQNKENSQNN